VAYQAIGIFFAFRVTQPYPKFREERLTSYRPEGTLNISPGGLVSHLLCTVYWEIFTAKNFSRLSVTAKITCMKVFQQRNTITLFLIQEVRCCPQYHPRQLLQQIEKWKKPSILQSHCLGRNWQVCLPSWCNCASSCLPDSWSTWQPPMYQSLPYSSTFSPHVKFRGRPIAWKFYSVKFFHANLLQRGNFPIYGTSLTTTTVKPNKSITYRACLIVSCPTPPPPPPPGGGGGFSTRVWEETASVPRFSWV